LAKKINSLQQFFCCFLSISVVFDNTFAVSTTIAPQQITTLRAIWLTPIAS
jgi:hypothetical protein